MSKSWLCLQKDFLCHPVCMWRADENISAAFSASQHRLKVFLSRHTDAEPCAWIDMNSVPVLSACNLSKWQVSSQQGKTNMTSCENQECLSHSCRIQEFFLQLIQTRQSYVLFKFHIYRITMQDGGSDRGGGGAWELQHYNTTDCQQHSVTPLTLKLWILKAGTKKTSWGHNLWKFFEVSSQTISRRL